MMLTPTRLKVRGFRGFLGEQTLEFTQPVTILFGENGQGKSSALNVLEWALFGDECAGKQTNIRERVSWEIPNRHLGASDVVVEMHIVGPEGEYIIQRSLVKPSVKKSSRQERLKFTLPDGEAVSDGEAERRLAGLLRCSFQDFKTMAYQHQEVIRDMVTQEPRHRNDAIDRLLGLSDYRNLLGGIIEAKASELPKTVAQGIDTLNTSLKARLDDRERLLNDKRREAADVGITDSQITVRTAVKYAGEIRQALATFGEQAG